MLDNPRLSYLNDAQPQTDRAFVVYWMQQSQREHYNHALQYAIRQANDIGKPLVVYFGLTECYPSAGERHYRFMLEGLAKTQARLADRDIRMIIRRTDPAEGAAELAKDACFCVVDRGYLRHHIQWRRRAAESMDCPLHQVESDIVVPVQQASTKEEYAARTIRPKINRQVDDFLTRMQRSKVSRSSMDLKLDSFDISNVEEALQQLQIDRSVGPSPCFSGGNDQAEKHLRKFVDSKLNDYPSQSNDPSVDGLSNMSPYLHFGQISPIRIALAVRDKGGAGVEDYLEELIVRRELAINFVTYSRDYTSLKGLPDWAQRTLDKHRDDARPHVYTKEELQQARTEDPYWNAAHMEMVLTGKMHGYMRMYWGKKVIEWTNTPEYAHQVLVELNDRYELDGRDPNGYTNILWCFGKHDRPWKEREIFGQVRYMNDRGLRRKFDADAYVRQIQQLAEDLGSG